MPGPGRRSRSRPRSAAAAAPPPDRPSPAGQRLRAAPAGSSVLQSPVDLAARVLLLQVATLVLHVLASRERDLDLGTPVLPVHARGDQRQPLLGRATDQAVDLALVHQQLARALGFVVLTR